MSVPNIGMPLKLAVLNAVKGGGIRHVAVKCLDMAKNPDCEGSLLARD